MPRTPSDPLFLFKIGRGQSLYFLNILGAEGLNLFIIRKKVYEKRRVIKNREIVLMVEQWSPKPKVKGSNPFFPVK